MTLRERIALWFATRAIFKQAVRWMESQLGRSLTRKEKSMFRNWKTTLLGWLAGLTGGTAAGWMTPDGKVHWAAVVLAVVMGALGHMAKDHDVTGV